MNFLSLCQLPKYKRYCRCSAKIRLGLLRWGLSVLPIMEIWQKSFHIFRDTKKCFPYWITEALTSNAMYEHSRKNSINLPFRHFLLGTSEHFCIKWWTVAAVLRTGKHETQRSCNFSWNSFPVDAVAWVMVELMTCNKQIWNQAIPCVSITFF